MADRADKRSAGASLRRAHPTGPATPGGQQRLAQDSHFFQEKW